MAEPDWRTLKFGDTLSLVSEGRSVELWVSNLDGEGLQLRRYYDPNVYEHLSYEDALAHLTAGTGGVRKVYDRESNTHRH